MVSKHFITSFKLPSFYLIGAFTSIIIILSTISIIYGLSPKYQDIPKIVPSPDLIPAPVSSPTPAPISSPTPAPVSSPTPSPSPEIIPPLTESSTNVWLILGIIILVLLLFGGLITGLYRKGQKILVQQLPDIKNEGIDILFNDPINKNNIILQNTNNYFESPNQFITFTGLPQIEQKPGNVNTYTYTYTLLPTFKVEEKMNMDIYGDKNREHNIIFKVYDNNDIFSQQTTTRTRSSIVIANRKPQHTATPILLLNKPQNTIAIGSPTDFKWTVQYIADYFENIYSGLKLIQYAHKRFTEEKLLKGGLFSTPRANISIPPLTFVSVPDISKPPETQKKLLLIQLVAACFVMKSSDHFVISKFYNTQNFSEKEITELKKRREEICTEAHKQILKISEITKKTEQLHIRFISGIIHEFFNSVRFKSMY